MAALEQRKSLTILIDRNYPNRMNESTIPWYFLGVRRPPRMPQTRRDEALVESTDTLRIERARSGLAA